MDADRQSQGSQRSHGSQRSQGMLAGTRIVVTRSAENNRPLVAKLSSLGAVAIEVPLVDVLAPADGGVELAKALDRLDVYDWVVLTSVNGVNAVVAALADRPWPAGVVVAPVGPATERAARSCGFEVVAAPATATAESLVASFPDSTPPGCRVLAPLAELAGDTVVDGLTARGYVVDRVTAYRTAAPPTTPVDLAGESQPSESQPGESQPGESQLDGADAIAFFSPSVIERFLDRYGPDLVPPVVLCVGPSTAARASDRNLNRAAGCEIVIAEPHTEDGIVSAAVRILGAQ